MRITTSMIAAQYTKNLNSSMSRLNNANNRATTWRRFDKFSESPMLATQAYRVRHEIDMNATAASTASDMDSFMQAGESALMQVNTLMQGAVYEDIIKGITGTTGAPEREIMAGKLKQLQQAIVSNMNMKFGGEYVFGGGDRSQPPFSLDADGNMLFRGADVTTGRLQPAVAVAGSANINSTKLDFGAENGAMFNGITINITQDRSVPSKYDPDSKTINIQLDKGATNAELQAKLQAAVTQAQGQNPPAFVNADASKILVGDASNAGSAAFFGKTIVSGGKREIVDGEMADLGQMANETLNVDLGLGLKLDANGNPVDTSVFNSALSGLNFLGFGSTSTMSGGTVANNLFTLMGDIADKLSGANNEPFDMKTMQPLLDNFETQYQGFLGKVSEFGSKANFITNSKKQLEDLSLNLSTKSNAIEFLDPTVAIMNQKQQEYAYNAALQMGTKIFSPTFLDFMR